MAKILTIAACSAAAAVAAYAAVGYLAVPSAISSALTDTLSAKLGRAVTYQNLSFNPWTWQLEIQGLKIAGKGSEPPLAAVKDIKVDVSARTITNFAPVIEALSIDGIDAQVMLSDPDIKALVEDDSSQDAAKAETKRRARAACRSSPSTTLRSPIPRRASATNRAASTSRSPTSR
jgi:hypothetical protein